MSGIQKEQIARVNCHGFGMDIHLNAGTARNLSDYSVIMVNPISIVHLFDKDPHLLRQIDEAQIDGMTSYVAKSDKLLESVIPDLDQRMTELVAFLQQGGLLIYFLCRPFLVQGPTVSLDNYAWLGDLAPDKPHGKNKRHMSSASRGKNIEVLQERMTSPFGQYLREAGLEWTTIIRSENLTDGYSQLASAGPNKCIAAQLEASDQGGTVIFLPGPYAADHDARLMVAVNAWYANRKILAKAGGWEPQELFSGTESSGVEPVPSCVESTPEKFDQVGKDMSPSSEEDYTSTANAQRDEWQAEWEATGDQERSTGAAPAPEPSGAEFGLGSEAERLEPCSSNDPDGLREAQEEPFKVTSDVADTIASDEASGTQPAGSPYAKDLINRMGEISRKSLPDWCLQYSFSDLDSLREELCRLDQEVAETQAKIVTIRDRIATMEGLKDALIWSEGDELMNACSRVLQLTGWVVKRVDSNPEELRIMDGETTVSIVRVVRCGGQPKRSDLASLAEALIKYWGEHEDEPKGILIASTWADLPPVERTEADFGDNLSELAEKKQLCLISTVQLLSIYRDVETGVLTAENLKDRLMSTDGRLSGFSLKPTLAASRR